MITEDQAVALLRAANPVPHPDLSRSDLDAMARLDDFEQRSAPVETLSSETKTQPPNKRLRKWTAGPVAAAVVLVLGVATTLTFVTDAGPFAGRDPTPVEIAEAYLEARNDYDVERALGLVSEDFRTSEPPAGFVNLETIELAFEQHQAYGLHYAEVDCTMQSETPEGAVVACEYLYTTELHRLGDHPPTQERLMFVIEDGKISRISGSSGLFSGWDPWESFLRTEHPEFLEVVRAANSGLDPESLRELVELLPRYFDLYEEWLNSQET